MKLVIINETLKVGDKDYFLENLFTLSFYKLSDSLAPDYYNNTFAVNELYIQIIQSYILLSDFIERNNITEIEVRNSSLKVQIIVTDIARKKNIAIAISPRNRLKKIKWRVFSIFEQYASAAYLTYCMFRIPYRSEESIKNNEVTIIRDKKAGAKIKNFPVHKEFEDYTSKTSIYRLFTRKQRLGWVLSALRYSFPKMRELRGLVKSYIGKESMMYVDWFYGKRVVHTLIYSYLLDAYFSQHSEITFYTGNNLDRYSVIEDQIAEKYNLRTICIPHGLEYGYRFPKGFSAQVFYTNSMAAAEHLNKLYNTSKFIFDLNFATRMFRVDKTKQDNTVKIVFFTEPREVSVNHQIISELVPLLKERGLELALKLHPKDNINDYARYNLELIQNLDDAILNNVCVSRKSTTLLEATYNGSSASAILTNEKDKSIFNTFPSLQSERISVFYSMPDLLKWIYNEYNKLTKE